MKYNDQFYEALLCVVSSFINKQPVDWSLPVFDRLAQNRGYSGDGYRGSGKICLNRRQRILDHIRRNNITSVDGVLFEQKVIDYSIDLKYTKYN